MYTYTLHLHFLPHAGQAEPGEGLERLAETHFVREEPAESGLLEEAHPVDALLLVGTEHLVERTERHGLESRVGIAVVAERRLLAPAFRRGIVEIDAVKKIEGRLDVGAVDALDAEPAFLRVRLRERAVAEDAAHCVDGSVVEEDDRAVLHDVAVAAVDGGLHFDG